MGATKLDLYNGALRLCKTRKLSTLTDNTESRRLLDAAYGDGSTNGAVKFCLESGFWSFATRTGQIDYTPSVEPDFGYRYAFIQPSDMVRPVAICQDEYFTQPLTQYHDERHYWYCDLQTIYVRWVSNGASYGADLSLWTEMFSDFVEAYLASEIVFNLTQDKDVLAYVEKKFEAAKKEARSLDAMNKPTQTFPMGNWVGARIGTGRDYRRSYAR